MVDDQAVSDKEVKADDQGDCIREDGVEFATSGRRKGRPWDISSGDKSHPEHVIEEQVQAEDDEEDDEDDLNRTKRHHRGLGHERGDSDYMPDALIGKEGVDGDLKVVK